jgi:haloalkane dehalogenase
MVPGMKDHAIDPGHAIADFQALFPDAPVTTFDNAGHFCQEDIPEILMALIHQFIQSTG